MAANNAANGPRRGACGAVLAPVLLAADRPPVERPRELSPLGREEPRLLELLDELRAADDDRVPVRVTEGRLDDLEDPARDALDFDEDREVEPDLDDVGVFVPIGAEPNREIA